MARESKQVLGHTGNGWIAPGGAGEEFGLYVTALRSQERRQQGPCEWINIKKALSAMFDDSSAFNIFSHHRYILL